MAEAAPQMTVQGLCDALDTFINSNRCARDDSVRWLADFLTETLKIVQHVRGGHLNEEEKKLINSYRLAELQKAKDAKLREIEQLDRDAKRLMNA